MANTGNIKTSIAGNTLTVSIDCAPAVLAKSEKTSTGKNDLLASTGGFIPVVLPNGDQARLSLSMIGTKPAAPAATGTARRK